MGGDVFLQACNRQDIEAQAILFQCIAKGALFRLLADQELFDTCGPTAVLDAYGLGAGQYMVYGRRVSGGVATPKWFHSGVGLSFVTRPVGRDVQSYFCRTCRIPLGMGS